MCYRAEKAPRGRISRKSNGSLCDSMKTFLAVILFLAILVFAALYWQVRREQSRTGSSKAPRKPPRRVTGSGGAPPRAMPAAAAPFHEFQADDSKRALKKILQDHIGRIFPGDVEPPGNRLSPLAHGEAQRHIVDAVMAEVKALKNFRSVHRQLQKMIHDPALQIGSELSKMVTSDPVLAAKILNTVNSPYYGMPQKVDSVGHALLLLGIVQLREILYRNGLLKLFRSEDPVQNEIVEALWRHATLTSICTSHLHGLYAGLDRGTLFTMGLLHDIGKLILLKWVGAERYSCGPTIDEEDAVFGINHAIIGRMALESWGFSDLMVSVIEQHHAPSLCEANGLDMDAQKKKYLIVLFFADQLAKLMLNGEESSDIRPFLPSYLPMIDCQRFRDGSVDDVLLSSILQSEAFAE